MCHLYLHGDRAAVQKHPSVHLTNGRRREWFVIKRLQLILPVWPQLRGNDSLLGESHVSSTSILATAGKINCSYTELFPLLEAVQSITDLNQTPP